uniref:Protein SHQ1 homolog n=1 Tax=Cacopsylla melanoneura TaxID=428564 RepID=A0A8D8LW26_9HEMI
MLTPLFELSQNEDNVAIIIKAPYANIADTEVYVEDTDFRFCSSPYYLRLHFPGQIKETEYTSGKYDSDKGQFTFIVNKINQGEHFPDLDLISKLLIPPNNHRVAKPGIEVLSESGNLSDDEDDDENDWFIEQEIQHQQNDGNIDTSTQTHGYGFANKTKGTLSIMKDEFSEVLDITDPDHTCIKDRCHLSWKQEQDDFDEDQYLADLMIPEQQEVIQALIQYTPCWKTNPDDRTQVSASEQEIMKQLGNREYLLGSQEKCAALLSLVNILYAYCYDVRTTQGEHTVESAWTINKLSSTLCWLQSFTSLKQVLISNMRRSLCYPLYREWRLNCAVQDDVRIILSQGKRSILKCLLSIHTMFNNSEPRYLLNQLYIVDYCIWIQQVSDKRIQNLADALNEVTISKSDLRFDLEELETAAHIVQEEEMERALCNHVSTLVLCSNSEQSDSSSSSSSSSSDESSDSDDESDSLSSSDEEDKTHTKMQSLDSDDTVDSD